MQAFLIVAAVVTFVVSVLGLIFASLFRPSRYLVYAQAFASGAFIGVSILHFMPRALHCFAATPPWSANHFPISSVIIVAVLAFLHLSERVALSSRTSPVRLRGDFSEFSSQEAAPLLMHHVGALPSLGLECVILVSLIFHSVIIGCALYFQHEADTAMAVSLLVNTAVEKAVEAFAVRLLLRKQLLPKPVALVLIGLYALGTPVTVLALGSKPLKDELALDGALMSVSAGVFLYIGVLVWRRTFLTPFDWECKEVVILCVVFLCSLVVQALTCISGHV
jgi:zinc transporter ZupT